MPIIRDPALRARLKVDIPRIQALKRDSVTALAAQKTLTAKPDDVEANLTAGKFALERGQFEQAFAMLAKCKDSVLNGLAKRELAPSAEAAEQVLLGDGWFDCAEKESNVYLKKHMQERAAQWYGNALPMLAGLPKMKVEGRLKTLPQSDNPTSAQTSSELKLAQDLAAMNTSRAKEKLVVALQQAKGEEINRGNFQGMTMFQTELERLAKPTARQSTVDTKNQPCRERATFV